MLSLDHLVTIVVHRDLGTKIGAKGIRTGTAAVGKPDLRHAHLDQGGHDGTGSAACPKNSRRASGRVPVRRVLPQVGDKARAIGVIGMDLAILTEDQGIGGPDQCGAIGDHIGDLEDGLLVRDGDV